MAGIGDGDDLDSVGELFQQYVRGPLGGGDDVELCRILSWRLSERLDPTTTFEILKEAGKNLGLMPTVVADSGVENVNAGVDQLIDDGVVRRVLAQVEVSLLAHQAHRKRRTARY